MSESESLTVNHTRKRAAAYGLEVDEVSASVILLSTTEEMSAAVIEGLKRRYGWETTKKAGKRSAKAGETLIKTETKSPGYVAPKTAPKTAKKPTKKPAIEPKKYPKGKK